MKWFKHMTAAQDDEKLRGVWDRYNAAGYGRWWLLLEAVAADYKAGMVPQITLSARQWSSVLRYSRADDAIAFLAFLDDEGLVSCRFEQEGDGPKKGETVQARDGDVTSCHASVTSPSRLRHGGVDARVTAAQLGVTGRVTVVIHKIAIYADEYARKSGVGMKQVRTQSGVDPDNEKKMSDHRRRSRRRYNPPPRTQVLSNVDRTNPNTPHCEENDVPAASASASGGRGEGGVFPDSDSDQKLDLAPALHADLGRLAELVNAAQRATWLQMTRAQLIDTPPSERSQYLDAIRSALVSRRAKEWGQ